MKKIRNFKLMLTGNLKKLHYLKSMNNAGIPLFFSILPAIILAGVPDYKSDKAVFKKTVAVIFGQKRAVIISIWFVIIAAISGVLLVYLKIISSAILITLLHAFIFCLTAFNLIRTKNYDRKISKIIFIALSYILWFGLIPLIYLIRGNQK